MTYDNKDQEKPADTDQPQKTRLSRQKAKLLKKLMAQQKAGRTLRPDDIGVVRIEFTIPAARLFGSDSFGFGGGGAAADFSLTDQDSDDAVIAISDDSDTTDLITEIPVPGPEVD